MTCFWEVKKRMNENDVKGAMDAILSLLGKTQLPHESMYSYEIPNSDVWAILVEKRQIGSDDLYELNLLVKEHRWKKSDTLKEGYWDIQ